MTQKTIFTIASLTISTFQLNAQEPRISDHAKFIPSYAIELCSTRTTNIVFRSAVSSVDRGSSSILVQKAKASENILQLKGGIDNFEPTNMTVLTKDGRLYSFNLSYNQSPRQSNIVMSKDTIHTSDLNVVNKLEEPIVIFSKANFNEADIEKAIDFIETDDRSNCSASNHNHKARLTLNGIYVQNDLLYLKIKIANGSYIDYESEGLRLFIRDLKRTKRTATQELEINPVHIDGNPTLIRGKSSEELIVAVPKFTIPDKKKFIIQLMEHNGGRHLQIKVSNRTLVKAKPVSF